jgi:hypothetical protein
MERKPLILPNQVTADLPPPVKRGRGRPLGSKSKRTLGNRNIAKAIENGEPLPHEILLQLARGKPVQQWVPDLETGELKPNLLVPDMEVIRDCAKAAAPYFAPKLSTVEVIQGVADDDLDSLITSLAAEAGISLGPDGEGEEDEEGEGTPGSLSTGQELLGTGIRRRAVTGT